jgi:5'-3' exonuclease
LVIDANNIAYACAFVPSFSRLSHNGRPTGVIHGTMQSLFSSLRRFPNAMPLVLWDGHAAWRKDLCPEYKGNRGDTPEKLALRASVREQSAVVQRMLAALGVPQARHGDAEADDLGGLIARVAQERSVPTRLLTSDTDWWQALSSWVDWQSARDDTVIDVAGLRAITKDAPKDGWAGPEEYLQAKIIAGDTSDKIPGIDGVGLSTAAKILRTAARGLDGILGAEFSAKGVVADRLRTPQAVELLRRNRCIMDWRLAPPLDPSQLGLWRELPDLDDALAVARQYGLEKAAAAAGGVPVVFDDEAWRVVVEALEWPVHPD